LKYLIEIKLDLTIDSQKKIDFTILVFSTLSIEKPTNFLYIVLRSVLTHFLSIYRWKIYLLSNSILIYLFISIIL